MKDKIIKYIKFLVPHGLKKSYRKYKRKINRSLKLSPSDRIPLTLAEFEDIIRSHLKIEEGDTLMVHSSFGNMNAGFSPQEAVDLLKKVVGPKGNILMPFYPTGHAFYWIQQDHDFDVDQSKSCMGILTQVFKESEGVKVSPHPVKAMSVWGKDRDFLIESHHKSLYPYDKNSPYYKSSLLPNSKTMGLGVEINSFLHSCEDLFLLDKSEIYADQIFKGRVNYYDGPMEVNTYLHEPHKVNGLLTSCSYLKETGFPGYLFTSIKGAPFYCTLNAKVLEHTEPLFSKGHSRTFLSNSK
ncbi:MAG: AAC(3) family N-acetyltransferase [Anditalea sp.]